MMGEGNRVASVILFTLHRSPAPMLTACVKPGPHAHGQLRLWMASWLAKAVVGLFQGLDELC